MDQFLPGDMTKKETFKLDSPLIESTFWSFERFGTCSSGYKRKFLAHSALPPTHTRPLTLTAHGEQSQNWTEKKQGRTEKRLVGAKPPSQHLVSWV